MSTTPVTFVPAISQEVPWHTRQHLQLIYQKLNNHALAFANIKTSTGVTNNTTVENVTQGGGGGGGTIPGLGGVNDQSGNTAYTTAGSDNGVLLILDDASPVAVTLNSGVSSPWMIFTTNLGAGLVTFTPSSGTINGAATFTLPLNYTSIMVFDGTNWFATGLPLVPSTFTPVAHEFLTGYNASTGLFSAAQPDFADISGVATTAQIGTGTPSAGTYVDGGTGAWTTLPAGAIVKIAEIIVGSAVATVNFSAIPGTYRNLKIISSAGSSAGAFDVLYIQFNGDSGTNYSYGVTVGGDAVGNSSGVSISEPAILPVAYAALTNSSGSADVTIYDYARTVWFKNATVNWTRIDTTGMVTGTSSLMWSSTAAITSILIGVVSGSNIITGSVFSLYGVV